MKCAGTVVLYNPLANIKENILSYISFVDKLYVIDNSSKSNENLLPNNKKIQYIFNNENVGIAKALNIACQRAIKDGYDFLLTMDQDSKFLEKDIIKLFEFVNNYNWQNVGIISPYHNILTKNVKSNEDIEHPLEVMTSGNLLNLAVYQKVEKFNEDLFIDCVDTFMCLNLKKNNYDIIRLNNVFLEHHLGNSEIKNIFGKKIILSNHSPLRRYYIMRNTLYVVEKFKNDFPKYCKYLLKVQRHQMIIVLFEKNGFKKFRYMLRGKRDFKKGIVGGKDESKNKWD